MIKRPIKPVTELKIENISGFFVRRVNKIGNSAKVDCPKEYLGRVVYIVVTRPEGVPTTDLTSEGL